MKETATVKSIDGKLATVSIEMHDGCESCMNGACKNGRSSLLTYNRNALHIASGDQVEIEIAGSEQARGALWVLGLPLAALFAGYGLGRLFFPSTGEGPAVASAGALFLITLGIGVLVQKARKLDSLPVITRRLDA